jgi:hypothetical protein
MTRPRKHEPRRHQINVRFSTREFVRIHDHADLIGNTVTDFGQSVMLRRPRRRRDEPVIVAMPARAIQRWRALGNLINLLAHDANTQREIDAQPLGSALPSLRLLLARSLPQFSSDAEIAA